MHPPAADPFFPKVLTEVLVRGLRENFVDGWLAKRTYIIAAGGAGSSGLPAFERGRRMSRTAKSTITTAPSK